MSRYSFANRFITRLPFRTTLPQISQLHRVAQTRIPSAYYQPALYHFASTIADSTKPKKPPETNVDSHNLPAIAHPNEHALTSYSPYSPYLASLPERLRNLAANLPPSAEKRPPTKDQLLGLTNSFLDRLKIRWKWITIRSFRRFRADDWSAFFSFGIIGTLGWFLIGTTSFLSFIFLILNSLSLQEWVARKLGDYLTASTGMRVVFESAIVPKWGFLGDGKIVFKNVYLSRGPINPNLGVLPPRMMELELEELRNESEEDIKRRESVAEWTRFHLTIDNVEVSLSLARWLDGMGLIKDAQVTGVRGVFDRSHVVWDPNAPKDRYAYRNIPKPGDFSLEQLEIRDFLVTMYQPDYFRPYTFSIFNASIGKFRKQWLFYDLLSAESITGQIDNCLFSLHKPQSITRTSDQDLRDASWSRMSRFRIDGVPIDHLQSSHDTGVMSWVTSGRCDVVADIHFPRAESELDLQGIVSGIMDNLEKQIGTIPVIDASKLRIPGRGNLSKDALSAPQAKTWGAAEQEADKIVSFDFDIRFKDLKASVPYFTSDLSYVNNALIRPIVAFINSNKTLIPIRCNLELPLEEFNGSWTTYDTGILDLISEQTYQAMAHHVERAQNARIQTVGLWTLQMTANAVLTAFKNYNNLAPF